LEARLEGRCKGLGRGGSEEGSGIGGKGVVREFKGAKDCFFKGGLSGWTGRLGVKGERERGSGEWA